jgi:hypothetical protein
MKSTKQFLHNVNTGDTNVLRNLYSNGKLPAPLPNVIISDLFTLKYNESEQAAKDALLKILKRDMDVSSIVLVIPESLVHLIPHYWTIESKGAGYKDQGINECAYIVNYNQSETKMNFESIAISCGIQNGIPKWQQEKNIQFLKDTWETTKKNGYWIFPDANLAYKKVYNGWELSKDTPDNVLSNGGSIFMVDDNVLKDLYKK